MPHPADTDADFRVGIAEVTAYGAAWKKGEDWPSPPVSIPIDYVTNAGLIWKSGETYSDDGGGAPGRWTPGAE